MTTSVRPKVTSFFTSGKKLETGLKTSVEDQISFQNKKIKIKYRSITSQKLLQFSRCRGDTWLFGLNLRVKPKHDLEFAKIKFISFSMDWFPTSRFADQVGAKILEKWPGVLSTSGIFLNFLSISIESSIQSYFHQHYTQSDGGKKVQTHSLILKNWIFRGVFFTDYILRLI